MDSGKLSMHDFKKLMANPYYAINIDPDLATLHEPMISKKEWATIMARNILEDEDGDKIAIEDLEGSIVEWMIRLLEVLEGDFVS